jgi:hypothetical protein
MMALSSTTATGHSIHHGMMPAATSAAVPAIMQVRATVAVCRPVKLCIVDAAPVLRATKKRPA